MVYLAHDVKALSKQNDISVELFSLGAGQFFLRLVSLPMEANPAIYRFF
jgi:hypothetical protein